MENTQEQEKQSDSRSNIIKVKIPWLGVEFEARGFTIVMTLLLLATVVNCGLLGAHLIYSEKTQNEIVVALKHSAVIQTFQACMLGIDQNERKQQLARGSDCWYMARGYDYGQKGPLPFQ